MLNKILLVLAVMLTISALGSALKCNVCAYTSKSPKSLQKCLDVTVECDTGYCYADMYTAFDGTTVVSRGCANLTPVTKYCPDTEKACRENTEKLKLKSCAVACCTKDSCNNKTPTSSSPNQPKKKPSGTKSPGSATGVMATKFTLCVMVIVGFLFA